ncbi:MAG: hydrogenase maturation nickel metallochaperone HypA, partial [Clostridia bacterium]|nr:hydrogenase maturation nickel metallochaperone HypA [Clostridia bacterium]
MHEISVLKKAVDLAEEAAVENGVDKIAYITLEVGELSGYLPIFFEKYFEIVIEDRPIFDGAELRIIRPRGEG